MINRFIVGKKNVEKRMNEVYSEIKKTAYSLNENRNSLKQNRKLLSLLKEYRKLSNAHVGFSFLTESWLSRAISAVKGAPTGKSPYADYERDPEQMKKIENSVKEINSLLPILNEIELINAKNPLGLYVTDTIKPLLLEAKRQFSDTTKEDYEAAEKLGEVVIFMKEYIELFGKNLRFLNKENYMDRTFVRKAKAEIAKSFPRQHSIDKEELADEFTTLKGIDSLLKNVNLVPKLKTNTGRIGEFLTKMDLETTKKSAFSHLADMFSGTAKGWGTMFEGEE